MKPPVTVFCNLLGSSNSRLPAWKQFQLIQEAACRIFSHPHYLGRSILLQDLTWIMFLACLFCILCLLPWGISTSITSCHLSLLGASKDVFPLETTWLECTVIHVVICEQKSQSQVDKTTPLLFQPYTIELDFK